MFLHLFCCTVHNIGQIPHQLFVLADILPGELECFLINFECLVGLKINYKIPFSYARIRHPYYDRQWPRQRAFRHQSASQSWATILVETNPVTILSTTWNAGEHLNAYLIGSRLHIGSNGCQTGSLGFTALTITLRPASSNSGLSWLCLSSGSNTRGCCMWLPSSWLIYQPRVLLFSGNPRLIKSFLYEAGP